VIIASPVDGGFRHKTHRLQISQKTQLRQLFDQQHANEQLLLLTLGFTYRKLHANGKLMSWRLYPGTHLLMLWWN